MLYNKKNKWIYTVLVRTVFIVIILCIWEYIAKQNIFGNQSELIFPSLETIGEAFIRNFLKGYAGLSLWIYIGNSMKLLIQGLVIGIFLSFLLSGLSMISKNFYYIKPEVIVLLVVHAVLWPMSRSILDGFLAVPKIYVEAGMNIGLKGLTLLWGVYLPAAMSYILSGLKVGWARAWRGLISAEMIFGIATCPGIGLFINQMRTNMNNAEMYATLIVIIIIGLVVQYGILVPIENYTIKKWGMSK